MTFQVQGEGNITLEFCIPFDKFLLKIVAQVKVVPMCNASSVRKGDLF
jgi:hypothetical protein